jgi:hypothetical protein
LKNRVPTTALLFGDEDINIAISITPYRAFTSDYPDFDKLRVFGCKAVLYKIEVEHPTTFEPRIKDRTWIFIRIEGNSIWKVLNVETLIVAKTTDARFDKYSFPQITSKRIQELE